MKLGLLITTLTIFVSTAFAGRVAHYPLDEPTGAGNPVVNDLGAYHGTLINTARVVQGVSTSIFATAYEFMPAGNGGGVNTRFNAAARQSDRFTVSWWFQVQTTNLFDRMVESMNGTVTNSMGFRFDLGSVGDGFRTLLRDGSGVQMIHEHSTPVNTGIWYFVAVRFDSSNRMQSTLIVADTNLADAVFIASNTEARVSTLGPLPFQANIPTVLGVPTAGGPAANAIDGYLDDVAFYNHVLTDLELAAVYNYGATTQPRTALLSWTADDPPVNDGVRDEWLPRLGSGFDWNFLNANGPSQTVVTSSRIAISNAYRFTGNENVRISRLNDDTIAANSFGDVNMGLGDMESMTFEIWIKPIDLLGEEVVWETGGINGCSITLSNEWIRFGTAVTTIPDPIAVHYALSATETGDFIQVVGIIDQAANETRIAVNGIVVDRFTNATPDWSGVNASGLGSMQENAIGGFTNNNFFGSFFGDIALINYYQYPLTDAEVAAAYRRVSGIGLGPDLRLIKTASTNALRHGTNLIYTLTVMNLSTVTVGSVSVTDAVPAEVVFLSATPPPTQQVGNILSWFMPQAPGGFTTSFVIRTSITSSIPMAITNRATVATTNAETSLANNRAQVITPVPDAEGDGLSDPFDPDDDNDGFADIAEVIARTDPYDPNSFLSVAITPTSNGFINRLHFIAVSGLTYRIEGTTNIYDDSSWTVMQTNLTGIGFQNIPDTNNANRIYYRIGVESP